MPTSYSVLVDRTKVLSTREFYFPDNKTHTEIDGKRYVRIDTDSKAEQIWQLLTTIKETDPMTSMPFHSMQSLHDDLVYAMDSEMERQIEFFRNMDIVEEHERATERGDKGLDVFKFDINKVVKAAARANSEWLVQVQLVHDLRQSYDSFRQYRIRNLRQAIKIKQDVDEEVRLGGTEKEQTESNWFITGTLVDQLQAEIAELELGVEPSEWFKVNEMMARITKRPMFSTRQFKRGSSIAGEWTEDRWWKGFDGSVFEALELVCVYVG